MTTPRFITAATYKVYLPSAPVQAYTIAAPVYHLSLDGIATPSVVRQFQPYPNGDGGVDQGFRLQPRLAIEEAARGMAPAMEPAARTAGTVNNTYSTVAQNYFTIMERGGGSMELAERVRLLNAMYTGL